MKNCLVKTFKSLMLSLVFAFLVTAPTHAHQLTGAGSSFIYPALSQWAMAYYRDTDIPINYQPIGSGAGQRAIFSQAVDFAASDQPLTSQQLEKHALLQFPILMGAIVPIVNLPGIGTKNIRFSAEVLQKIYMGLIVSWDDPGILSINPNLAPYLASLEGQTITVVHRSDGSGTSFNFVNYLDKNGSPTLSCSTQPHQCLRVSTVPNWKIGIGGKQNAGVAQNVKQIPYSVGYVEYAYAAQSTLKIASLVANGQTIDPTPNSFKKAARHIDWSKSKDFYLIPNSQNLGDGWPLIAATFILIPKKKTSERQKILTFIMHAFNTQRYQTSAQNLNYITMPEQTISSIQTYIQKNSYHKKNQGY